MTYESPGQNDSALLGQGKLPTECILYKSDLLCYNSTKMVPVKLGQP